MKRVYALALTVLIAAFFVVLLIGSLSRSLGTVTIAAVVLYVADRLLVRTEDSVLLRRLREVGADPMWRTFYRQVLVTVFVLRWGHLSRSGLVVVVLAVLAHHLLLSLHGGVNLMVTRNRMRRIETRNLPVPGAELPPPLPAWLTRRAAQMHTELFLLAGLFIAYTSGSSNWISWGAAAMAVSALLFPLAVLPQLRTMRRLPDDETRLAAAQQAVLELKPDAILYFSGGLRAVYQVNMWLETMERLDRPVLVLLRERRYLHLLPATTVPVLTMPYTSDLMNFDFTGARIALYVANVGRNLHMLRVPTLKSAFIGHGDSDKTASFNPYSKVYDEVWVAGEAGRQRYVRAQVGVRADEVVVVGRPQLDGIQESMPRPEGAPFTVLYAPTWEGWVNDPFASSLMSMGREMIAYLLQTSGVRVLFKPHPLTGSVNREAAAARDDIVAMMAAAGPDHVAVLDDEQPLYDCFDQSDALISDISSVVSDYLRSEKPYFVTNGAGVPDAEFRSENPSAGAAYLIGPEAAGLAAGLSEARGGDPRRSQRHEVRAYLLGDPDVESMTLFRNAVDDLAAKARAQFGDLSFAVDDDDDRLEQQDGDMFTTTGSPESVEEVEA